jgi:hypothetical protein
VSLFPINADSLKSTSDPDIQVLLLDSVGLIWKRFAEDAELSCECLLTQFPLKSCGDRNEHKRQNQLNALRKESSGRCEDLQKLFGDHETHCQ